MAGAVLGEPGAQCTEPPGPAAARVDAAGPSAASVWQAQDSANLEVEISWQAQHTHSEPRSADFVAGAILSKPRSADFVAGAVLSEPGAQILWQAQYRRSTISEPRSADFVAGAVLGEPGAQILWEAQCTKPPGPAAARVGAAGPRAACVWQASKELVRCTSSAEADIKLTHNGSYTRTLCISSLLLLSPRCPFHSLLSRRIFPSSFLINLYFSWLLLTMDGLLHCLLLGPFEFSSEEFILLL